VRARTTGAKECSSEARVRSGASASTSGRPAQTLSARAVRTAESLRAREGEAGAADALRAGTEDGQGADSPRAQGGRGRPAHSLPTQEEDWQPDEGVRAQQQGLWSPGSPQSQEVSAGPAGQPRARVEDARPAERQSAEEQSELQSDGRRDPVAPEGSAGPVAGLPGSAHPSAEAVEAAGGGAATGDGGSARLSAGGPAAAPLQSSSPRELESEPGASPASGQQTAAAGSAPGGAWAGDGAGGDSGAGLQASDGQRAASARGAPGPQGRQPAQPPAGGSSYAPLQEGDFGYTAAKPPAVKVPSPDRAAFRAVSCFLPACHLPAKALFLVYQVSSGQVQRMAAQVREKRLRRARYQEPLQAPALAAAGVGAPASPMFGWITEPDGSRRICPRCEGRGFIRSAAVRTAARGPCTALWA